MHKFIIIYIINTITVLVVVPQNTRRSQTSKLTYSFSKLMYYNNLQDNSFIMYIYVCVCEILTFVYNIVDIIHRPKRLPNKLRPSIIAIIF